MYMYKHASDICSVCITQGLSERGTFIRVTSSGINRYHCIGYGGGISRVNLQMETLYSIVYTGFAKMFMGNFMTRYFYIVTTQYA